MNELRQILDRVVYHNSVRAWAIATAIALALFVALLLLRRVLVRRVGAWATRTNTVVDDAFVDLVGRTRPYFLAAIAIAAASRTLEFPPRIDSYGALAFALVLLAQLGVWGTTVVNTWVRRQIGRRTAHADATSASTIRALGVAIKILLWSIFIITALAKVGVNVTALVTGLGIGGVAIALAVQNVLGDLFAALAIVLDKPFDVGDFIVVDDVQGTVEHIGLKTTRLRSLGGEQVIVGNAELLKNRIRNFKRMFERRVVFFTDVPYDTPPEAVARIPGILREIVSTQQPVRFDRSHFTVFTDSALRVETVYIVLDPDYNRYLDIQQRINLELLRRFAAEGLTFALPSRTMIVREQRTAERADGDGGAVASSGHARPSAAIFKEGS